MRSLHAFLILLLASAPAVRHDPLNADVGSMYFSRQAGFSAGQEAIPPASRRLPCLRHLQRRHIAQAEFDQHRPQVIVGSSRGGAGAMNINSGDTGRLCRHLFPHAAAGPGR